MVAWQTYRFSLTYIIAYGTSCTDIRSNQLSICHRRFVLEFLSNPLRIIRSLYCTDDIRCLILTMQNEYNPPYINKKKRIRPKAVWKRFCHTSIQFKKFHSDCNEHKYKRGMQLISEICVLCACGIPVTNTA